MNQPFAVYSNSEILIAKLSWLFLACGSSYEEQDQVFIPRAEGISSLELPYL